MTEAMPVTFEDETITLDALQALHDQTGISGVPVAIERPASPGYGADGIELNADGISHRYVVECKRYADRREVAAQAKSRLSMFKQPGLLIAPYISKEIAEYCRQIDLQFIDTHGNAYLHSPGMRVYIKGEKDPSISMTIGRATGANPTALRIHFVLLCLPSMVNASFREIKESAGVSLGAVSAAFEDLKRRGFLIETGRGRERKLLDPSRLFEEWVTTYAIALRPKLKSRRFSAPDPDWWRTLRLDPQEAVWGGEVAAEQITGYLKPAAQTLYVVPAALNGFLRNLVSTHRLRADPQGQVEILEKFWNLPLEPNNPDVAPPVLVYADLMATLDPRNIEVAKMIRDRLQDAAFHQA